MTPPKDDELVIRSQGPPPERYADRIIAAMLRDLADRRTVIPAAIAAVLATSKDGTENAQRRLRQRVLAAGAVFADIKTGTRGRYRLLYGELLGWDRDRDAEIKTGDLIPQRPQLAVAVTIIEDRGRSRHSVVAVFFSFHSISRMAQRFGVRTKAEIVGAIGDIFMAVFDAAYEANMSPDEMWAPPATGRRVKVGKAMIAVLAKHEKRKALIVKTVVFDREGGTTNRDRGCK